MLMLAANSAKTDALMRSSVEHGERIGALEQETGKHKESIERFEHHIKTDTPAQQVLDGHAWTAIKAVAAGVGLWFLHGLLQAAHFFEGR